jgi:haloalkane dehalogenase
MTPTTALPTIQKDRVLRTPEARFANLPALLAAGHRVIAPDLVGFGRSDKPSRPSDYSYLNHVQWMTAWMEKTDLLNGTLFCPDWGSLIGLRMVTHSPHRFARVVLANGGLPTGTQTQTPKAFKVWRALARFSPWFPIGGIVNSGCIHKLTPQEIAAYDAPYPSKKYEMAARIFPTFVLKQWNKPFLTLFSRRDPITRGGEKIFQKRVPGAAKQPHAVTRCAGHFLQEDKGPELARQITDFISSTPVQPVAFP